MARCIASTSPDEIRNSENESEGGIGVMGKPQHRRPQRPQTHRPSQ